MSSGGLSYCLVSRMKQYPSIPFNVRRDLVFHVYDKLDGSNIRVEWKRKQGRKSGEFYKFGSRKQLLATDQGLISKAPELLDSFEENLERYFIDNLRIDRGLCYFELHGSGSFAGVHKEDDEHALYLLDVEEHKRGFISQKDYMRLCEDVGVPSPECLAQKVFVTPEYEYQIRSGQIGTFEGVVCKASTARDKYGKPIMFKIKNKAWIQKVKEVYAGNEKLLKELL